MSPTPGARLLPFFLLPLGAGLIFSDDPVLRGLLFSLLVWLFWRCRTQNQAWYAQLLERREGHLRARLSALMREAADAILLADAAGRLLEVNLAAERLYRFGPGEMIGMPLAALFPEGSRPQFEERWRHLAHGGSDLFDTVHRRKDGTHLPVEISLHRLVIPEEAGQGSVGGVEMSPSEGRVSATDVPHLPSGSLLQCVVRDRTEAQRRERQAQQQRVMALALGAAPDLSTGLSVTLEGLIRLTGSTMGGIHLLDEDGTTLRLRLSSGFSPALAERMAALPADHPHVRRIREGGIIYSHVPHPGLPFPGLGRDLPRFVAVIPIQQGSAVVGCLSVAADRADMDVDTRVALETSVAQLGMAVSRWRAEEARIRAEQQLRQAEKLEAVGQLAGGIAHDFNNLLGVIMGCAEMLQIGETDAPTQRQFAGEIVQAARQAGDLTRKLLAFARRGKFQNVPVRLHDLLDALLELLQRTFDRRIDLAREFAALDPVVMGDPGQLQTIFLNLALNARDAMPDGGRLTVATRATTLDAAFCRSQHPQATPGEFYEIAVTDTGRGISPEVLPHLFEPFFTTKSRAEGSGMGLAAVFGAVSLHHGTLAVTSEPDRGTCVRVFLPRATPTPATLPADTQANAARLRIMVIDDEEMVRATFGRLLTGLGHQPILFREGHEALEFLHRNPAAIDLAILDLMLPGMAGPEIFRELRAVVPDLPILIATGLSARSEAASLLAEGARGLLQKPFQREDLASALAGLSLRPCRPAPV